VSLLTCDKRKADALARTGFHFLDGHRLSSLYRVLTVTPIDRLARSTFDLFAIVKQIVDAKAQFRSLAEPWADTSTSTGRLMIAVLGGLADAERDLIRTRTAEGRSRAQKRRQHMGRPSKLTDAQKAEARWRRAEGATLAELARSYGVGRSTISRLMA
jgi:DNA invertase Pin-like site-specific DNA recombinase